ncbi:MAG: hypothetical protein EA361_11090 [Bacteroidetes bacterium]|nr:MAG: hypothetical protein EA361_11090 [Bacteroidota bacterium]
MGQMFPEKGVPPLESFTPYHYYNTGKIWSIASAPNGIVYMAADRGLLEYDGTNWNHYTGSKGFTRSVKVINDSLMYTGSDLDFGVWRKTRYRGFEYTSLYPFEEDLQDINEEFWSIHLLGNDALFVSSQSIYVYRNEQLLKIAAPSVFMGSYRVDDRLYFFDKENGIFVFEDFSLKKELDLFGILHSEIAGIYRAKDGLMIVARDEGLFLFKDGNIEPVRNELSEKLKTAKVFSFEPVGDNHVAFGTVLKGLYIANLEGEIIHHVNRQKGLPSNTVLSLHYCDAGRIWLGMDYGVSSLDLRSRFTTFYDYRGDFGTGYTAILKDEIFYLGTNQGLYRSRWGDLNNDQEFFRFELIPDTEGQVWTLELINEKLLMGHDKGLFVVEENNVEKIGHQEGVWTIIPYKDYILTGNYNGISIFQKSDGKPVFLKKMDLIYGSCNQLIAEEENILWVNIPTFGVIRAVLDETLNPVERLIFPKEVFEGKDAFVLKNDSGVHVFTDQFRYTFDSEQKEFILKDESRIYPQIDGQLAGVYLPVALHPDYDFFPVYNGFALRYLVMEENDRAENYTLTLRKFEAFNNHERVLLYPGSKVPSRVNNIFIETVVPNQHHVEYQFKLQDSGEWSEWGESNSFELLSLRHGAYKLLIRARIDEQVADEQEINFRIVVPWYLSWYAYLFYAGLFAGLMYVLFYWQEVSLKKQKKKMLLREQKSLRKQTEKHKHEIMLLERKRMQAEYDQLKQQLKTKTIELANKAKDNEEKNRLLLSLKEKCEKAQQNPVLFERKWGEMQRILDSYLKNEDKTFEIQMDELHQEFFAKLKEKFPDLSSNDLRLCAYLRIGLNTKEIAEMLNIQPSSFYISRSRLRKKLKLKPEEDLYNFLTRAGG